ATSERSASSNCSTERARVRSTGSPNFRTRASAADRRAATSGSSSSSPCSSSSSGSTSYVRSAFSVTDASLGAPLLRIDVDADAAPAPRGGLRDGVRRSGDSRGRCSSVARLDDQLAAGAAAEPEQRGGAEDGRGGGRAGGGRAGGGDPLVQRAGDSGRLG